MMCWKINSVLFGLVMLSFATAARAYDYDANDFATEVVEYVPGDSLDPDWIDGSTFTNPYNALGRPTVDTTGENWNIPLATKVPVVPVYSPFRSFELVSVGDGGHLTLKFSHPVRHDKNNPYGIDFIIFGNAQQNSGQYWKNGNPNNFVVSSSGLITEPGKVSVSQDGVNWYRYANGPYADSFASTMGRIYDPCHPDTSIGTWNQWWAKPTNPTVPLDPAITAASLAGKTIAQISQLYGESAGGTGFSLNGTGLDWIQYVRVESNTSGTPDIDAVADVAGCGDYKHPYPVGDLNGDCVVDYKDLKILSEYWLMEITVPNEAGAEADIDKNGIVNFCDWALMAENWLACSWDCE